MRRPIIFLDTNILRGDPRLTSGPAVILLDYARRTQSRFLFSQLIADEFIAVRRRYYEATWQRYLKEARALGGVPGLVVPAEAPDFGAIAKEELQGILKRLDLRPEELLPATDAQLREALQRGINRTAPCRENGEEVRDAVIWQQVRDLANGNPNTSLAFISGNTRDFGDATGQLLPELSNEVRSQRFRYYSSLDAFAKQQAAHMQFVTKEWIISLLDGDQVAAEAWGEINELARRQLQRKLDEDFEVTEQSGYLELDAFYVYEMEDQSLRLEMEWFGRFDFEGKEDDGYRYRHGLDATGDYGYHYLPGGGGRASAELSIVVQVTGIIREKTLSEWKVTKVESV